MFADVFRKGRVAAEQEVEPEHDRGGEVTGDRVHGGSLTRVGGSKLGGNGEHGPPACLALAGMSTLD